MKTQISNLVLNGAGLWLCIHVVNIPYCLSMHGCTLITFTRRLLLKIYWLLLGFNQAGIWWWMSICDTLQLRHKHIQKNKTLWLVHWGAVDFSNWLNPEKEEMVYNPEFQPYWNLHCIHILENNRHRQNLWVHHQTAFP